ncbi:unnamed protein product [Amoebophrya sp. A120]|nr:unnamed protein product [Amoebophrya sp. A120]|eukprot:GSA120T00022632001.1
MPGVFESISFEKRRARDRMVFMYYDKTGKGVLNKQNTFLALQAGGALVTEAEFAAMVEAKGAYGIPLEFSTKKNKGVNFEHFGEILQKCILRNFRDGVFSPDVLRERFRMFIDERDTVSMEVIRYISTNLGEKLTAEQADTLTRTAYSGVLTSINLSRRNESWSCMNNTYSANLNTGF